MGDKSNLYSTFARFISASQGNLIVSKELRVDGTSVNFNNLPTTSGSVSSGELYTLSGSQIGATSAMAERKFVLVKE